LTSTLDGVGGQRHAPAAFTPREDPVPIVQEAGWAPEPLWIGVKNLAATGIWSPDLPARRESNQEVGSVILPGSQTGVAGRRASQEIFWVQKLLKIIT